MTVMRRSGASWRESEAWSALAAYVSILVLPFLVSGQIKEWLGEEIEDLVALLTVGWLFVLIVVVTPFRMWRDSQAEIIEYKNRMVEKFSVTFDKKPPCIETSIERNPKTDKEWKARFIRVRVSAKTATIVRECIAHLTNIEILDEDGTPQPTSFSQPVILTWTITHTPAANIPPDVDKYINIVRASSEDGKLDCFGLRPLVMRDIFIEPAIYRITIVVSSESQSINKKIDVKWSGDWSELDAEEVC